MYFDPEIIGNLLEEELESRLMIGSSVYHFNMYQRDIINALSNKSVISFSAPTSFGKSFIVRHNIIQQFINSNIRHALIVVPTKALIDNFYEGVSNLVKTHGLDVQINTHSRTIPDIDVKSIYILTQERVTFLIEKYESYVRLFDLIYCDEAHYISRGYRGFLLRNVIEKLIAICGVKNVNGSTQYIFSSPKISNPIYFKNTFFREIEDINCYHKRIHYSPVEKNIHLIKKNEHNYIYSLLKDNLNNDIVDERLSIIGTRNYTDVLSVDDNLANKKRDVDIILNSNLNGGTILYATSPLSVHKYAKIFEEKLQQRNLLSEEEIQDIEVYIRDHYDVCFDLIEFIRKGIGLHYGPMPIGLRRLMVELFESKAINYIICTSTLLEGVNLPAKNIVIVSDIYNNKQKHNHLSFSNLIGRAGRITYGLSGNIYCISDNIDNYKSLLANEDTEISDPAQEVTGNDTKRNYVIRSLIKQNEEFKYIKSPNRNDIEYLLYELLTINNPISIVNKLSGRRQVRAEINEAIERYKISFNIPVALLKNNPGIDPRLQNALYNYLNELNTERLQLVLEIINNPHAITAFQIRQILERTEQYLKWPKGNNTLTGMAMQITQWLHEAPLSQFIQYRLRRNLEEDYYKRIELALDTVKALETQLSFNAPKYIKCFFDVAIFVSRNKGILGLENYIDRVEYFIFSLEAGITSSVGRYLFERGVSRPLAIKVKSIVSVLANDAIDTNFFRRDDVDTLLREGLSVIAYKELNAHLS